MNDTIQLPRTGGTSATGATSGTRRALTLGGLALAAAALSACGSRAPAPTQMDLGPVTAWPAQTTLARRVDLQSVGASEMLQGTGIAYRLSDSDPYARRVYRDARWAAPLPVLVATRLRQQFLRAPLAAGGDQQPAVAVSLELEESLQNFSGATRSEVQVRVTATAEDGTQRAFDRSEPAGASADGAVRATAAAVDALGPEIAAWAAALPVKEPRGRARR